MPKLSVKPFIHETANVSKTVLGRYTEIDEGCHISECEIGDYSYLIKQTEAWCATIGKFASIASHVRINATNHPTWRATQHHFTYRADEYFDHEEREEDFFCYRRENRVVIGHDVWIGHGAIVLPGVCIGNGAVIGAGAVVTKDVEPYMVVGGVPAKAIKRRFSQEVAQGLQELGWWDWPHDQLHEALLDFRNLKPSEFIEKYK